MRESLLTIEHDEVSEITEQVAAPRAAPESDRAATPPPTGHRERATSPAGTKSTPTAEEEAAAKASGAVVSSAPAPAASQASPVTTGGSGASDDASAPLALERETDTLLDVYWPPMDKTYRGVVVETRVHEKHGVDGVIVSYKDGQRWHDFGPHDQNCTFTVIEPPIQAH